jgi:hypothetical protein
MTTTPLAMIATARGDLLRPAALTTGSSQPRLLGARPPHLNRITIDLGRDHQVRLAVAATPAQASTSCSTPAQTVILQAQNAEISQASPHRWGAKREPSSTDIRLHQAD